jgi:hypothetical protein
LRDTRNSDVFSTKRTPRAAATSHGRDTLHLSTMQRKRTKSGYENRK